MFCWQSINERSSAPPTKQQIDDAVAMPRWLMAIAVGFEFNQSQDMLSRAVKFTFLSSPQWWMELASDDRNPALGCMQMMAELNCGIMCEKDTHWQFDCESPICCCQLLCGVAWQRQAGAFVCSGANDVILNQSIMLKPNIRSSLTRAMQLKAPLMTHNNLTLLFLVLFLFQGLPLHLQIDTFEDPRDTQLYHRGYCQIKVFCDKVIIFVPSYS